MSRILRLLAICLAALLAVAFVQCGSDSIAPICDANTCHGHGTCDDSSGAAVCTCDEGWGGSTCDQCAEGYEDYGDGECRLSDPCAVADCASRHRDCTNEQGTAVCGDCQAGYHESQDECVLDETCGPNSCNGHGACDDSSGSVVCTCDPGYSGRFCSWCAQGYEDYGDGECRPSDPCAGSDCAAQNRECTNDQGAAVCGDCLPGYHDEDGSCVADLTCQPDSCSGHGECDDTDGVICICDEGYRGDHCEACDLGYQDYGDGECRPSDPCASADCAAQNRECTNDQGAAVCGGCLAGFHDDAGDCVEDTSCGPASCNGHGSCDDTGGTVVCTCDPLYTGEHCTDCVAGYTDYGDGECRPEDPCAGDETCAAEMRACENVEGVASCGDCLAGYHEEEGACVEDLECLPTSCSGHGDCDDAGGEVICTCLDGYSGDHCEDCADGYTHWPPDGEDCVPDPCQPDPCDLPHASPDGCVQTGEQSYVCACESGYEWDGEACAPGCRDVDHDGYGEGPGCLGADCDDRNRSVYEGAPELCDGLDNDCDDETDEDFPLLGAACDGADSDECENGTTTCMPDGSGVECVNESVTDIPELCNGEDDDCDGETDEDFPQLGTACDGADSDECTNGTYTCMADGSGVECVNESVTDIQEVCDGADNDCNGTADDPFITGGSVTYDGGPYAADAGKSLGDSCGTGNCFGGTVVCTTDGTGLTCDTLGNASPETCDDEDQDCNGAADDPFVSGGGMPFDGGPYPGDAGKYKGDACGTGACANGTLVCLSDGSGLTCDTLVSAASELCDDADNDCDGTTDDPFIDGTVIYDGGPFAGDAGKQLGEACGTGACANGLVVCTTDMLGLTCDTLVNATPETCDDADQDCNGTADDPFVSGGGMPFDGGPYPGDSGKVKGDACGTGSCANGQVVCKTDGSGLTCNTLDSAAPETCDDADQDCNGTVDDPYVDGTVTYAGGPYPPDAGKIKGDGCGTGSCANGQVVCTTDGSGLTCNTLGSAAPELCDDADNDCDGETDDPFTDGSVTYDGGPYPPDAGRIKGNSCGTGACLAGTVVCTADLLGLTCSTLGNAAPELCDDADNDCDGTTDDPFIAGGPVVYDGGPFPPDAGKHKGDACGTGNCAGGAVVCTADLLGLTCDTLDNAGSETCDDADQDCNGTTDDPFVAGGPVVYDGGPYAPDAGKHKGDACGTGDCAGGTVVCTADEAGLTCDTLGSAAAERCDTRDNDCNGMQDDPFMPGGAQPYDGGPYPPDADKYLGEACGTGDCAGGLVVCLSDESGLTCSTLGAASGEVCDSADNDCNGVSDDTAGCACVHALCTEDEPLWSGCSTCVTQICTIDPACCSTAWDSTCVTDVRTVCGSLTCPESAGSCAHSLCVPGVLMDSGCDAAQADCVSQICALDSWCCTMDWDSICVFEVDTVCGLNCNWP
ncbi:MAG: putative metal-binding motif-containing protein [Deltaproteobacteria bacterium]|nr:putative metal-binding motif-containing protein [Deltaproteobacteria bacterium]